METFLDLSWKLDASLGNFLSDLQPILSFSITHRKFQSSEMNIQAFNLQSYSSLHLLFNSKVRSHLVILIRQSP